MLLPDFVCGSLFRHLPGCACRGPRQALLGRRVLPAGDAHVCAQGPRRRRPALFCPVRPRALVQAGHADDLRQRCNLQRYAGADPPVPTALLLPVPTALLLPVPTALFLPVPTALFRTTRPHPVPFLRPRGHPPIGACAGRAWDLHAQGGAEARPQADAPPNDLAPIRRLVRRPHPGARRPSAVAGGGCTGQGGAHILGESGRPVRRVHAGVRPQRDADGERDQVLPQARLRVLRRIWASPLWHSQGVHPSPPYNPSPTCLLLTTPRLVDRYTSLSL